MARKPETRIVCGIEIPAEPQTPLVEALLWCAFYALESGRYADYTVVDQAARACSLLQRAGAKGYVNALLRNFLRSRAGIEARLGADAAARYWHPDWWIERLRAAYPADWESVLAAGNTHPPMCLRVNVRRSDAETYAALLAAEGMGARRPRQVALVSASRSPTR